MHPSAGNGGGIPCQERGVGRRPPLPASGKVQAGDKKDAFVRGEGPKGTTRNTAADRTCLRPQQRWRPTGSGCGHNKDGRKKGREMKDQGPCLGCLPAPRAVLRGIARRADTGRAPSGTAGTPEPGGRRQAAAARLSLPGSASGTTLPVSSLCSLPAPLPPGETEENTNNIEEERTACRAARAIALPAAGSSQQEEAAAFSARKRFSCGEAAEKAAWHSPPEWASPDWAPAEDGAVAAPCHSCEIWDCLHAGSSTGDWPKGSGWDTAPTGAALAH
ncbi:uncharacterized protein LOC130266977 [Oenanthe melanoleuca]|uniref:uncharacterized protein LOC130254591 n=1 Tax=Oenanthe melanoleuca TaxID=2939378 RepID=UPI0024C16AE2|nr:uncharacterized protein LOC130254559 isoform X2 [Oenanthe melanoleuca]XP_056350217.1 uncharacterized protein LOC130254559 isoform X2 [Oenanthe melanoleuca]XP_056350219.1 uncharacterized protein LOC130254559 isoform X2 [Oenanthe melanoleuca]XP_056350230.1 uncharacterized protein LOC130254559 isoform X2 [Oenanthe melanoleuca]XP_056350253.1 uncharacterized protein LOC130254591 [Oenanthe melanoleuca]XP_056350261.1 uncharacterized protein LOC130254591 [Oenanthe melanoleuca]XP_056371492.1 unchar